MKPVGPNALDRLISLVAPGYARQRVKDRAFMALTDSWAGASKTRNGGRNWWTISGDADSDTLNNLKELRTRSRDLMRNSALARGAILTKVTNIVGSGLKPQCKLNSIYLGLSPEAAEKWQQNTEREFALWAESIFCDAERSNTFYGLQELAFLSCLENGDVFANLPFITQPGQVYELCVQLIEADRVNNPQDVADGSALKNGNAVYAGVEKDTNGAPVAYHVSDIHPGSYALTGKAKWTRIEALGKETGRRNILHLFRKSRIGQSRGVPDLAPVIEPLKQLERYTEAEITAAVINGAFTVFVKTTDGEGLNLPAAVGSPAQQAEAQKGNYYAGSGFTPTIAGDDRTIRSGSMFDLLPGEDVVFADPKRPSTAFGPFVHAIMHQIGTALELPPEVIIKQFEASYSAARAALLEAWRYYLTRRTWLANNFCQPIYEEWLAEAVATGRIDAPGFFDDPRKRQAYSGAVWIGPGRGQINPEAETAAAIERINAGLSTREAEILEMTGSDWNDIHNQNVIEHDKRVAAGLEVDQVALADAAAQKPEPTGKPEKPRPKNEG